MQEAETHGETLGHADRGDEADNEDDEAASSSDESMSESSEETSSESDSSDDEDNAVMALTSDAPSLRIQLKVPSVNLFPACI